MIIWLDAQLSPGLASWIQSTFNVQTQALRDIGLRDAEDQIIYEAARTANATLITKDSDFIRLHYQNGAPPKIIWLTCGNTSNRHLRIFLTSALPQALLLLEAGESLVELTCS